MKFFKDLVAFIKAVASDPRIPDRDKTLLLAFLALIASPIDIIPDWIPVFGMLDDVVIIAIVLDYLFNHLDREILLSHYPWGMKSFIRVSRVARSIAVITPRGLRERIWKFRPDIY